MSVDLGYGIHMVTRAEWGARPPRYVNRIATPTPELWLHHTAGAGDDGPSDARAIQDYHMDVKGWSDIAYSFLVDDDGTVYEGRGAGVAGGHTAGHNTISHAICAMGNYEVQAAGPALLDAIRRLGAAGRDRGWWPGRLTGGHRDASGASTACPGRNLYAALSSLTFPTTEPPEDDVPAGPAVVNVQGVIYTFGRSANNELWYSVWDGDPATLSQVGWANLGGNLTSGPSATVTFDGKITVMARGTDGAVWARVYSGGVWGGWFKYGGLVA